MHIHILGICGTFMGGIAVLAKQLGHRVTGSDTQAYPPMSTQLQEQGIVLMEGYDPKHLDPAPNYVVIGNALSRGNPAIEYVLAKGLRYTSGPQWLAEQVLQQRWVLAVAGTHGKTSTSSMLAWILEAAGLNPGFLIGGVPQNFGLSARLGQGPFVIEADEYDTAFFDKRSKFVHYRPRTAILNNLEYDHADIFPNLAAIQQQFNHLVRTIPNNGLIVVPEKDQYLQEVLQMGCWTPVEKITLQSGKDWRAELLKSDGSEFAVYWQQQLLAKINWTLLGSHNVMNAVAAIVAARHVGVAPEQAGAALEKFQNVKRRLEVLGQFNGITLYDDFAHHPTAIATTLAGLRAKVGNQRILAIVEPRSNTMKLGVHKDTLGAALQAADKVWLFDPEYLSWDLKAALQVCKQPVKVAKAIQTIVTEVIHEAKSGDHIVVMSNGSFGGIYQQLIQGLQQV